MKQIVRGLNGEDNVVRVYSVMDARKYLPQTDRIVLGFEVNGECGFYRYYADGGWGACCEWAHDRTPDFWMDIPEYIGLDHRSETRYTKDTMNE